MKRLGSRPAFTSGNPASHQRPSPRRGWAWVTLLGLALAAGGQAQTRWQVVAVPYYTPQAFAAGQMAHWYAPQANDFAKAATDLAHAVHVYCNGTPPEEARASWQRALLSWDRLSTVAAGPLIERRSLQRVDFAPIRAEQIARAIARKPGSAADMEQLPNAAKGFGALEYLLWAPASTTPCPYAARVANDILAEAEALAQAFGESRLQAPDDTQAAALMSEAVNQWIGAVEKLRMQGIERPLREAQDRRLAQPAFARGISGASAAERATRWQTLESLAVLGGGQVSAPGNGLVPMETYLRGKGLNALADRLVRATQTASTALRSAASGPAVRLHTAARRLATLKSLVEAEVAPALDIRVGFTDADGD